MPSQLGDLWPEAFPPVASGPYGGDMAMRPLGPESIFETRQDVGPVRPFNPNEDRTFHPLGPESIQDLRPLGPEDLLVSERDLMPMGPKGSPAQNAFEEFQSRQPAGVNVAGGSMSFSMHQAENSKISSMAHKIAGIPQIVGIQLGDEAKRKISEATNQVLSAIQNKMGSGKSYDDALLEVYTEMGSPPIMPQRAPASQPDDSSQGGQGGYGGYVPKCPPVCPPDWPYCPVP